MKLTQEQLLFFYNEIMGLFNWDDETEQSGIDPLEYVREEVKKLKKGKMHLTPIGYVSDEIWQAHAQRIADDNDQSSSVPA